ncbi:MAG: tol-pal system-associated acyl-CoA thioesterase [Pseudomonadota bacterium]
MASAEARAMENAAAQQPAPPSFTWPVRVYYEDTDAGGIVYYANYLRFMERARSEWLRALGVSHRELRDANGLQLVVARADTHYRRPAELDDELTVTVKVERVRRASLDLRQDVTRGGDELLCTSRVQVACMDAANHRPRPFPPSVLRVIQ